MKDLPLLLPLLIVLALFLLSQRTRRKTAVRQAEQQRALGAGSRVMTTSGLYGTIVGLVEEEDSARLEIAPGVVVTWARAALRPVAGLPERYRGADRADVVAGQEGSRDPAPPAGSAAA